MSLPNFGQHIKTTIPKTPVNNFFENLFNQFYLNLGNAFAIATFLSTPVAPKDLGFNSPFGNLTLAKKLNTHP
jgi:hypothetical protein